MSFDAFLDCYPDDEHHHELIEGAIVEVFPMAPREDIGGFLSAEFNFEIRRAQKPYSIPRNCLIRPSVEKIGHMPDVVFLDCHVEIIRYCVWLHHNVSAQLSWHRKMMLYRDLMLTYGAIRDGCLKFAQSYVKKIRK